MALILAIGFGLLAVYGICKAAYWSERYNKHLEHYKILAKENDDLLEVIVSQKSELEKITASMNMHASVYKAWKSNIFEALQILTKIIDSFPGDSKS